MAQAAPGLRAGQDPRTDLTALAWGLAEATFFFLVPDVFLSRVALRAPGAAGVACLWALAGALIGGAAMYAWGAARPEAAADALDLVPGVDRPLCDSVRDHLRSRGLAAVFLGPVSGVPYKIYAVKAGTLRLGLLPFLAVSVPARLVRFALVTGLAALACRLLPGWSLGARRLAHGVLWAAFYAWYFAVLRG